MEQPMKAMKIPKVKKEKSTKPRMTNSWVDFLKDYAKSNNITYSCALSDPRAKDEYKDGKMTTKDYSKPVMEMVEIEVLKKANRLKERVMEPVMVVEIPKKTRKKTDLKLKMSDFKL